MASNTVDFGPLFQLSTIGVDPAGLSFNTVTMESEKYVCVREKNAQGTTQLVIVDMSKPGEPMRRPIAADSAIMNPAVPIIALKSGTTLQIFDLTQRKMLKVVQITENVVFWTWISKKTVGIVTETAVYHWTLGDTSDPAKVFDRHNSLANTQIINYKADCKEQWLALIAISASEGGKVAGHIQLYSVSRKVSQPLEGHAATFATIQMGGHETSLFVFASKPIAGTPPKMHVIEVGTERKPEHAPRYEKKAIDLQFTPEQASDFPIALNASSKYAVVYMLTKMGYLYVFDLAVGFLLYYGRITDTTIFVTSEDSSNGGMVGVNRGGQVISARINPDKVIPFVMTKTSDPGTIARIAAQSGFPGADNLFISRFRAFFNEGRLKEAALVAVQSPGTSIRNSETISLFKGLPQEEGKPPALLVYFQVLLEHGKLNQIEAVELAQQVTALGRVQLLEKWVQDDKLECSEELGNFLKAQGNLPLAMTVYVKGNAHNAVLRSLIENGQIEKVVPYAQRVNISVNIPELVQLASTYASPQAALDLANALQSSGLTSSSAANAAGSRSMYDIEEMFNMFLQKGMLQEATAYVLDNLKQDIPDAGKLQTSVLKANLSHAPPVADAILKKKIWSHFDKFEIAQLCERAGLYSHALVLFSDMSDIKRVLGNTTHPVEEAALLEFFSTKDASSTSECLKVLLKANPRGNLQVCVQVAAKHLDQIGAKPLMEIFATLKIPEAMFLLLQAIVPASDDPDVHFALIEESIKIGQFAEAERITKESTHYNPEKVKNYLMSVKARDPRPLINVCDRFNYVEELIKYMVRNGQLKFVEGYVTRINSTRCPVVCGILLDLDQDEEFIKNLVLSVKNTVNVADLTAEFEKRNKLKILLSFFEAKASEGSTDPAVHTGLAKVYIETNVNPEHFLETNQHYDPQSVGKYCENRDPFLAVCAYKKGKCDDELIAVTEKNALFKEQAKYVVDREDPALWARLLAASNPNRKLFVDQVMSSALPETQAPEKVSATVKAFMTADLPALLIELLEKLVVQSSNAVFSKNRNLQNLLILTSIKTQKERAMEYIKRLDNYDGNDIAQICLGADMYEEALAIYIRFKKNEEAVGVIVDNLEDFDRAEEFANKLDEPAVWSRLGVSQLKKREMIAKGVSSLLKAHDPAPYEQVIHACKDFEPDAETYDAIIKYLKFVRTKVKDVIVVDTEIIIGLARCDRLTEMEEFLSMPNHADLEEAGERCLSQELLKAAKLLFSATNNYGRLAVVLVKLKDYAGAAESARKSNKIATWRSVCFACVDAKEFRLAQVCGLHLVVEADQLQDVLEYYQKFGYFQELLTMLDSALIMEKAHQALFTETGILYTKYREDRIMEFCKMWWQRCSVPKLIRACGTASAWAEKAFLHMQYNEAENALQCMMEHPTSWDHAQFLMALGKATNMDALHRCVAFYMNEHFEYLNDLLIAIANKTDPERVISILKTTRLLNIDNCGILPLCKPYLFKLQEKNLPEVNEAVNEILLLENNVDLLKESIKGHPKFDQLKLARKLEYATAIEYRRISASLFRENKKFEQAVEISKRDKLWKDAIESASASRDPELVDFLSRYFLDNDLREAYTAVLLACYEFFPPALALEYSWTYSVMDFSMPFFIQTLDEISNRVMGLEEINKQRVESEESRKQEFEQAINEDPSVLLHGVQHLNIGPSGSGFAPVGAGAAGGGAPLAIGWQKP